MHVVIDIDENVFTRLFDASGITRRDMRSACTAIRNGTPLPKGHGRLIDADRLKADNPRHMDADVPYVTEVTVEEIIDDAPTIIEADKKGDRE